jgi:tetratricopeptide (TPR) repeat protein
MRTHAAHAVALLALPLALLACKSEPTPAEQHLNKANELYRSQDYKGAAAEFEQSLTLDPKQDIKIWEKGAFSYMKAGDNDKAAGLLLKSVGATNDAAKKAETYRNVAGMYLQAGVHDKADQYFGEALKLEPKDDQSLQWRAEIASILGGARKNDGPVNTDQLDLAIKRYDELIALTPAATAPYINKRIAISRYLAYLTQQKALFDKDPAQQQKLQARFDDLKANLDATTKKLGEVNKAARAGR